MKKTSRPREVMTDVPPLTEEQGTAPSPKASTRTY